MSIADLVTPRIMVEPHIGPDPIHRAGIVAGGGIALLLALGITGYGAQEGTAAPAIGKGSLLTPFETIPHEGVPVVVDGHFGDWWLGQLLPAPVIIDLGVTYAVNGRRHNSDWARCKTISIYVSNDAPTFGATAWTGDLSNAVESEYPFPAPEGGPPWPAGFARPCLATTTGTFSALILGEVLPMGADQYASSPFRIPDPRCCVYSLPQPFQAPVENM